MLEYAVIGAAIGFCVGMILSLISIPTSSVIEHIKRNIYLKRCAEHDEELDTLSQDTQIILRQYMNREDVYGRDAYVVNNIKAFDAFLTKHISYKTAANGYRELDQCIKDCLANGTGFIIWMNGEQYVAIVPPIKVDPDGLIK